MAGEREIITGEEMLDNIKKIIEVAENSDAGPDVRFKAIIIGVLPTVCAVLAQINKSLAMIAEQLPAKEGWFR